MYRLSGNVISVASIGEDGYLSYFSNYGNTSVDVAVPGENILSTSINNTYIRHSGTSMAAAHISRQIALLFEADDEQTPGQIKEKLIELFDINMYERNSYFSTGGDYTENDGFNLYSLNDEPCISAGTSHTVAVKSDGTVWAWGSNTSGRLGDGTTTQRLSPVEEKKLKRLNINQN
jgi:subtilisin family serine protease